MKNLKFSLLVAAATSAMMTAALPAATQTWYNAGPSNDWSTTAGNWDGGSIWTQNNSAIFGGTGETVTVTGPVTADDLTFNSNGYTIAGGTLTLAGTPTITTDPGVAAIINSILAGTAGLTKAGTGTLTLGGANTFTGTVNVNEGILTSAAGSFLGGAGSAGARRTVNIASGAQISYTGGGNAFLNFGNTYGSFYDFNITGTLAINDGGSASQILQSTYNLLNGGVIANTGVAHTGAFGLLFGWNGAGGGNITATGTGNQITADRIGFFNSASITTNAGADLTITSIIKDGSTTAAALIKNGTGTLILQGANSYTGATTLNGGTLALDYTTQNNSKLSNTGVLTLNGGTIDLRGGSHTDVVGSTVLNGGPNFITRTSGTSVLALGAITRNNGATLDFGADNIATTTNALNNGILGTWATVGGTRFATKDGANLIFGLVGTTALTVNDFISATANYEYSLSGGTDTMTANRVANTIRYAGTGETIDLGASGANTLTFGSVMNAGTGTLVIQRTGGTGSIILSAGGDNIFATTTGAITINAPISSGALSKSGLGTLTLGGANTYSGNTVINAGTLITGSVNTLSANSALSITTGATLNLNSNNQVVGSLADAATGGGLITNGTAGTAVLTAGGLNTNTTFTGTINDGVGTVGLTKVGTGTLTLTGANTFSGALSVNAGTLLITGNNTFGGVATTNGGILQLGTGGTNGSLGTGNDLLGTGGANLLGGGLVINRSDLTGVLSSAITGGAGTLTLNGTGRVTMTGSGANTYTGVTTLNAGSLVLSKTAIAIAGDITMSNAVSTNLWFTQSNQLSGNGVLTFSPSALNHGRFMLEGTNQSVAGIVNTTTSGIVQNAEGTFDGGLANTGAGTLTLTGSGTYAFGGFLRNQSGTLAIVKNGTGTQTFSGDKIIYTGGTTINSGSLIFAGAGNAIGGGMILNGGTLSQTGTGFLVVNGALNVATNSVINVTNNGSNNQLFFDGGITGASNLTINNTGTATTGVNFRSAGTGAYTGALTVNGGQLGISNNAGQAFANSNVTLTGASLNLTAIFGTSATNASVGSLTGNAASTVTLGAQTLTINGLQNATFAGAINSTTGGIVKNGTGTQTLSGTNNYATTTVNAGTLAITGSSSLNGATTVNTGGTLNLSGIISGSGGVVMSGGTLNLDYSTQNNSKLANGTVLTLGGGTVNLVGGSHTETVGSTTFSSGFTKITRVSGTSILDLGAITRLAGATVDFTTGGIATTTTGNDVSGIIGAWMTVNNGADYAFNDGSLGGGKGYLVAAASINITRLSSGGKVIGTGADPADSTKNIKVIDGTGSAGNITLFSTTTYINTLNNASTGGIVTVDTTGKALTFGTLGGILQGATAGGLTIGLAADSGSLTAGGTVANVAGAMTITNGSTTNSIIVNSTITNHGTGAVSLTKGGAGKLVLNGTNTYTGGTTLLGGTTVVGRGATGVFNQGSVALAGGAILDLNGFSAGAGNVTLSVLNDSTGAGGVVTNNGATAATFTFGGTTNGIFSGNVQDGVSALSLVKVGTGTQSILGNTSFSGSVSVNAGNLTLGGNNSWAGPTTIASGSTLQIGNGGASGTLGSGGVVTNDGTLFFNRTGAYTLSNTLAGAGTLFVRGGGTMTITGTVANTNGLNMVDGGNSTVILAKTPGVNAIGGNIDIGASGNYSSGGTLQLGASDQIVDTAIMNLRVRYYGQSSFFKLMGFNETIGGLSGFTNMGGPTVIRVLNGGATDSTLTLNLVSGTRSYTGTQTQITDGGVGKLNIVKTGAGTQILGGTLNYTGTTTVNAGVLSIVSTNFSSSATTVAGGTLDFNGVTMGGTIAGTSGLVTITGGATTTFGGAAGSKTYSAGTNISGNSTLSLSANNAFSANSRHDVATGSTLSTNAFNGTIGSLTGTGSVTLTGPTDTLGIGGDNTSGAVFAGVISDIGSIEKVGTGVQILTGTNTYTGLTTITNGTLQIGNAGTAGTLGAGNVVTAAGGTLDFKRSDAVVVSNQIGGAGIVRQSGAGTTTLSGASTYTGETQVTTGILKAGVATIGGVSPSSGAFGVNSAMTISGGATVDLNGFNQSIGSLNGTGGVTSSSATSRTLTVGTGDLTGSYSGVIGNGVGGTTALTKTGGGIQTLTGANTYTGLTTVGGGTLNLGFGTTTTNIISSGSALVLGGGNLTLTGAAGQVNTQSFSGTTITAGSTVTLNQNSATSLEVNLGAFSFVNGGITFLGGTGEVAGARFITTTSDGVNNGTVRLSGSSWNGTNFASIKQVSGVNYIVQWTGTTVDVLTDGTVPMFNGGEVVRIIDGVNAGVISLSTPTNTIDALTMTATTFSTTVDTAGTTFIVGAAASGAGDIAINSNAKALTIGVAVNNGFLTSGTTGASALSLTNASATELLTINSVIKNNNGGGAVTVNVSGGGNNGTVVLNGTNTYTGNTNIGGGTLQVAGSGSLGSGNYAGNMAINGGSLQFSSDAAQTLSGAISGTGGLIKDGATGTLILTGTNTYQGTTVISTGSLQIGAGGATGTLGAGSVTNDANLTFNLNNTASLATRTVIGSIGGTGTVNKKGDSTIILTAASTYSGLTTIEAGTLQIGNGGLAGTLGTGSVLTNGTLAFNRSNTYAVNNQISGTGGVSQIGTGTTTLSGFSSYTGVTTISSGTLEATILATGGSNSSIGAATTAGANLVIGGGGTLAYAGTTDGTTDRNFQLNGNATLANTSGNDSLLTLSGGGDHTAATNDTLTLNGTSAGLSTLSGALTQSAGTLNVVKNGTNTWALTSASSNYTGTTIINAGILQVAVLANGGATSSIGSSSNAAGNLVLNSGATLSYIGNGSTTDRNFTLNGSATLAQDGATNSLLTWNGTVANNGTNTLSLGGTTGSGNRTGLITSALTNGTGTLAVTKTGATSTWILSNANTYSGLTTVSAGTLQIGNGGSTGTLGTNASVVVSGAGLLAFNRNDAYTVSPTISGSGSISQIGTGTTLLSKANTYTGNTTVTAGILRGGIANAFGSNSFVTVGTAGTTATMDLGGFNQSIGSLTGNTTGVVTTSAAGAVTLTTGTNNQSTTYAGVIQNGSGTVALTKVGNGGLSLTGTNSYSGTTTISAGFLQIGNNTASGTLGSGNVVNNAALVFNRTDAYTATNVISGTGIVQQFGAGTTTLSGANTYTGKTQIFNGAISTAQINSVVTNVGLGTVHTATSGLGSPTTVANGTIDLGATTSSGKLIYTGTGEVTDRVINLNGSIGGGTIDQSGTGNLVFVSDFTATGLGNKTLTLQGSTAGTGELRGNITDSTGFTTSLVKDGTGTWTLLNNNTYTGTTTISGGTLQLGNGGTLGNIGSGAILNNGNLVFNRSNGIAYSGQITGSGNVTQIGSGTTVLTGTSTYTGKTTIANGAISVDTIQNMGALTASALGRPNVGDTVNGYIDLGSAANTGTLIYTGTTTSTDRGFNLTGTTGGGTLDMSGASGILTIAGNISGQTAGAKTLTLTGSTAGEGDVSGVISNGIAGSTVSLTKTGTGLWELSGNNTYSGLNTLAAGILRVDNTSSLGSGNITFTGGTLQFGAGSAAGDYSTQGIVNSSSTMRFDTNGNNVAFAGNLGSTNTAGLTKSGAGTLTLSGTNNNYTGATAVNAGTLRVNGAITSASPVTVASGGTLTGSGTITGTVNIANGGHLAGAQGTTLTTGALTLNATSVIDATLGGSPSGTALFQTNGNLTLDGVINVTSIGSFGAGLYRIFNYTGSLTNNGLDIGAVNNTGGGIATPSDLSVQTAVAGQVNIVNTAGFARNIWDGPGAANHNNDTIEGGTGIWNATNDNWTDPTGSLNGTLSPTPAFAIFTGTAGTVTVDNTAGQVTANGMQFAVNGYTITGGSILLVNDTSGKANLWVGDATASSSGYTATIASVLTGAANVEKTDAGTLILSGDNTYTGTTTIAGGTLQIGSGGTSGTFGTGDVINNAALVFNRSDASAVTNLISGTGTLTKNGAGTITLSAANTYTGVTTVNAGTLAVTGSIGSTLVNIATGGTLAVSNGAAISDTAAIVSAGTGAFTLNASETIGSLAGTGTVALGANTLTTGDATNTTYAGVIGGTGGLAKAGSGTFTLSGVNTYTGATDVNVGTLAVTGSIASTAVNIAAGATLAVSNGAAISDTAAVVSSGTGVFTLNTSETIGSLAGAGSVALGANTLTTGGNNTSTTYAGAIAGTGGLTKAGSGNFTLSGANTYTGATAVNAGTLTLTGSLANTAMTVASGATLTGSGSTLGTVNIQNGGTIANTDGTTLSTGALTLGATSITAAGLGATANPALVSVTGNLTLDGTLNITDAGGFSTDTAPVVHRLYNYTGSLTNNTLAIGTIPPSGVLGELFVQTAIAGQVNLVDTNGAILAYWDGDNALGNNSLIEGGDGIWLGASGSGNQNWTDLNGAVRGFKSVNSVAVFAASAGTVTVSGTTDAAGLMFQSTGYVLNGGTITLANVGVGAPVVTLTTDAGVTATVNSVLTGSAPIAKAGTGTLILGGVNTYSGVTSVDEGTLSVTGSIASATVNIADNATLAVSGGAAISDTAAIVSAGTGAFTLNASEIIGSLAGTGTVALGANTLTTGDASSTTYAGVIGGTGGLTKAGAGTFTLSGVNTYTGTTSVNAGTLDVTGSIASALVNIGTGATLAASNGAAISDTAAIVSAGTGALTLNASETIGSLAGTGTVALGANTLTTGDATNTTYAGVIGGTGGLAKAGSGTFTLSGVNTYTGATDVNVGTLAVTGSIASTLVNIASGATLAVSGGIAIADTATVVSSGTGVFTLNTSETIGSLAGAGSVALGANTLTTGGNNTSTTYAGAIAGTGGLTKAGTGNFTLSGANTYTGATAVNAGTLTLTGSLANTAMTVASGATLTGSGSTLGTVNIQNGGTIANTAGTTLSTGALTLGASSITAATLGATANPALVSVTGNLTLDGTLNIASTGDFSTATTPVVHRLYNYTGSLTDNTLEIGSIPGGAVLGDLFIQTAIAGQVNLIDTNGTILAYWDGDSVVINNNLIDGGNGTWLGASGTGSQNWTDFNGSVRGVKSVNSVAVFAASAGTVTVSGTTDAAGLMFQTTGYVLNGGTITLVNNAPSAGAPVVTLTTDAGVTATVNSVLDGSAPISKAGTGTLILGGVNTYSGVTTVNEGTLSIAATGSIASATVNILDGATLAISGGTAISNTAAIVSAGTGAFTLNASETIGSLSGTGTVALGANTLTTGDASNTTYAGAIAGSTGGLTKAGSGTFTLSGVSTYTGVTNVNVGTLAVTGSLASASVNIASGATLAVSGSAAISDTAAVVSAGTGAFTLNASEIIGSLSGTGTVALGAFTLTTGDANPATYAGVIAGTGGLTKAGSGTFTLSGANTYTGVTAVNVGTLAVSGSLASTTVNIATGATLAVTGSTASTAVNIATGGTLAVSNGAAISDTAAIVSAGTGAFTLNNSETIGSLAGAGTVGLGANTLTTGDASSTTYAGAIAGTGGLTKAGSGDFTLSGSNSYTGATAVNAGTLILTGSLANTAMNVASGATLTGSGTTLGTVNIASGGHLRGAQGSLLSMGALTLASGSNLDVTLSAPSTTGLFQVTGNLSLDGAVNVTGIDDFGPGIYRIISYTGTLTNNGLDIGTVTGSHTSGATAGELSVQTSVNGQVNIVNIAGAVRNFWDGSGMPLTTRNDSIIQGGSGTWTATDGNWTTSVGDINGSYGPAPAFAVFLGAAGTVTLDETNGALSSTGAQFAVNGYTLTGDDLTLVNTGSGGTATLRVGDGTSAGTTMVATIGSVLKGAANVTKTDLGTLVLTAANTYTGFTAINAGVVEIQNGSALGSAASGTTVLSGAALRMSGGITVTGEALSLSGTGIANDGALRSVSGANTYTGAITLATDSRINTDSGSLTLSGGVSGTNTALTIGGAGDTTISGVIATGTGTLTKEGLGKLTLSGVNTYTGATAVNAGTLTGSGTIAGTVSIASGAHLANTQGTTLTTGALTLSSGAFTDVSLSALSTTRLFNTIGNLTVDGTLNITGTGTFGAGSYRLFDYTGTLTDGTFNLALLATGTSGATLADLYVDTSRANEVNLINLVGVIRNVWDGSGATNDGIAQGGAGVWNAANRNWTDNGTLNGSYSATPGLAEFGGATGGIITVDNSSGQITASGLHFKTTDYAINGGALTLVNDLTGSVTLETDAAVTATIGSVLQGAADVVKAGAGTLVLTGDNTYSGTTAIQGGTLQIGNGGTSGSLGTGDVVNDAALVFNRSDAITIANAISGTGSLAQIGAGTTILTADNTYSGTTTISTGTLQVGAGGTTGSLGSGDVTNNAALVFNRSDAITVGNLISGTGTLTQAGTGTTTLTAANTYTGDTNITGGTLALDLGSTSEVINPGHTVNLAGGTLDFLGAGSTNTQTFGTVNITGGTNHITNSTFTGTVANGGGVDLGNLVMSGGTLDIGGLFSHTPNGYLGTDDSWIKASGLATSMPIISASVTTNNGTDFVAVNASGNLIVADSLPYQKGATAYSNSISAIIKLVDTGDFGAGNNGNGTITLDPATQTAGEGAGHAYWLGIINAYTSDTTTLDLGTSTLHLGTIGAIASSAGSDLLITGGNLTAGGIVPDTAGTLDIAGSNNIAIGSKIVDNGAGVVNLTKAGTGRLTLTGVNTYTGTTEVNGGTLAVNGSLAGGAVTVNSGGTLTGTGTIAGTVSLADGATLANSQGATLTTGAMTLAASTVSVSLATPSTTALFHVNGDLTLDGTLDIAAAGQFGFGSYRLFDYTGTLTDNGLELGLLTGAFGSGATLGDLFIQTSVSGQVNLINTVGLKRNIWDGGNTGLHDNGAINGGSGVWIATNRNWAIDTGNGFNAGDYNGTFSADPGTATFRGAPGTVTVDNTDGQIVSTGLFFETSGYIIDGEELTLANGTGGFAAIDTATGVTATISSVLQGSADVVKSGTGTLILSGDNTYTGTTTIAAGTVQVGAGNLTATTGSFGAGEVINNGSIVFNRFNDNTVANLISGTGSVTIASAGPGAGKTILTVDNTYSGGTTINSGASLQIGNGGTAGNVGTGAVVNNGTLTFNRSNELVIAGNISGSGDLVQQGAGTTILAGNDTYAGHITINDGAVQVGQGTANSTAFTGLITNNKALVFDSADTDLVISAVIEGAGTISHDGTGTTTLTGNNTYTGLTTVNAGLLNIGENSSTGAVTINEGGTLGGRGIIRGDLINRGVLAPGFSPGTLGVVGSSTQTGNFIQTSTGVFRVELASLSNFDKLNVAGTASLDGTLDVQSFGGFTPSAGETYTILTAGGGVSGTFATLLENYAGLKVIARYNANDVTLLIELDQLDGLKPRAIALSLSSNRIATAGGLDDAMLADPNYVPLITEVGALNDAQFAAALAALSPQSFEHLWDNTKYNTVMLTHAVENRMQTLGDIEPSENFWMQAARRVSQSDGDDDLAKTGYYSNGVIIGADTSFGSNFNAGDKLSVGAMFSYTNDKVDLGNGGKSTVNHYLPGIYARYASGDAFVEGTAAWGYADYSNKRRINIGATERNAKSHTEAQDRTIGARAGYEFHLLEDAFRIAPYAGFQHTRQEIDGFTETGAGLANLSVHDMKAESTVSRLGLLMNSPTQFGDWVITPKLDLAWRHEFQQSRRDISANFGPAPFTVRSTLPAADAFEANFGFDVKITPRTTIYADVGTFWDGSKGHSEEYRVGVNFKF